MEKNNKKPKPVKLPDSVYWRFKKKQQPKEEYPGLNGEVKIIKPAKLI